MCDALAAALARHGAPEAILTDNGKVFTARFGPGSRPVLFDRICHEYGIKHLLTAPYSPTTTGKVERLHKTLWAELFGLRAFASLAEAQTALDAWVEHYNTMRPHQGVGDRPPAGWSRSPNQSQPSLPRRPPRRRTARHLTADPNRSLHRSRGWIAGTLRERSGGAHKVVGMAEVLDATLGRGGVG